MGSNHWAAYVSALSDGVGVNEVGERVGVSGATISRWRSGRTVPRNPAEVAAFAMAFGGNVLEAFVAAGWLTREQARLPARQTLAAVPAADLAAEVTRRLTGGDRVSPRSYEAVEIFKGVIGYMPREEQVDGPAIPLDVAANDPGEPSQYERVTQEQDDAYDIDQSPEGLGLYDWPFGDDQS